MMLNEYKTEILLIEENSKDASGARRAIRAAGLACHVTTVTNAAQTFAHLARCQSRRDAIMPDLILLDIDMVRADGRAILDALKSTAEHRAIPVAILTASRKRDDIRKSFVNNAYCFLAKSVEPATHEAELTHWLERFWMPVMVQAEQAPSRAA